MQSADERPEFLGEADLERGLRAAFGGAAVRTPPPTVLQRIAARAASSAPDFVLGGGAPPPPELEPGAERPLAGHFLVGEELGRGGMGVVRSAWDVDLGREVALKVLARELTTRPEVVRRFVEEARIGAQLQHPGIVPVHELGLLDDERPFFAMRRIEGRTLAALLRERRDPADELPRFLAIFAAVCRTVAYAHSRGVVHRDLKPSNVMVGAFGEVQVVDWGLARATGEAGEGAAAEAGAPASGPAAAARLTQVGAVVGTPGYMPPEQARGELAGLDRRGDVFGLGAILCEVLSGEPPFSGGPPEALAQTVAGNLDGAFARLAGSGADPELVALARACLAPVRDGRPSDAQEVAERLQAHLNAVEERAHETRVELDAARRSAVAERRARRLATGLSAAAVLLAATVGGAWWLYQADQSARIRSAVLGVQSALAEAGALRGEGRWGESLSALARGRAVLDAAELPDAALAREREQLAALERTLLAGRDAERVEAENAALLAALTGVRRVEADPDYPTDWEQVGREFAAAFEPLGVAPLELEPEVASAALAARGLGTELAVNLDLWALAEERAGDAAAAQHLRELVDRLDPDPQRGALRAALAARDLDALRAAAPAAGADSPVATRLLAAEGYSSLGARDEAAPILIALAHAEPASFLVQASCARALIRLDRARAPEAVPFAAAAHALRPESGEGACILGIALFSAGRPADAAAHLAAAVARVPEDPKLWYYLAMSRGESGDIEGAVASYARCAELDPDVAVVHHNRGVLEYALGRGAEAAASFLRATEIAPDWAPPWRNLGAARQNVYGDLEGAIAACERAVELDPEHVPGRHYLALYLANAGRYSDAVEHWRAIVAREPQHVEALRYLAWTLAAGAPPGDAHDPESALEPARAARELAPEDPLPRLSLGIALHLLGRDAEALEAFAELEPLAPEGRLCAALSELRTGRESEARARLVALEGELDAVLASAPGLAAEVDAARAELARAAPPPE